MKIKYIDGKFVPRSPALGDEIVWSDGGTTPVEKCMWNKDVLCFHRVVEYTTRCQKCGGEEEIVYTKGCGTDDFPQSIGCPGGFVSIHANKTYFPCECFS